MEAADIFNLLLLYFHAVQRCETSVSEILSLNDPKHLGKESTVDEMGRACGTYVQEEKCMYSFGGEAVQGMGNFEDLGLCG
jgi:hypothetical protein